MEAILIIHGTLGNDSEWWLKNSTFCNRLNQKLAAQGSEAKCWQGYSEEDVVHYFRWDGKNSETSRMKAALNLAETIHIFSTRNSLKKIHFIAHSHGGNVLLKALMLSAKYIEYSMFGKVVFLGTPFFKYGSLNPKGSYWRRMAIRKNDVDEIFGNHLFSIMSRHDEAMYVLNNAIDTRKNAYSIARNIWAQSTSTPYAIPMRSTREVSLFDLHSLMHGRYLTSGIRTSTQVQYYEGWPLARFQYGFNLFNTQGIIWVWMLLKGAFVNFVNTAITPISKMLFNFVGFCGTYLGLKAGASKALGDDHYLETINDVSSTCIVLGVTELPLEAGIEKALLDRVLSNNELIISRIYECVGGEKSVAVGLPRITDAIFESSSLVHCFYYEDDGIIDMISEIIASEPDAGASIRKRN